MAQKDGDGSTDTVLSTDRSVNTYHLTIETGATVTLKDMCLTVGRSFTDGGASGEDQGFIFPACPNDRDGEQVTVPFDADADDIADAAGDLPAARLDGEDGLDRVDSDSGGAAGRGADAAGSIFNEGNLRLVRTGFYANGAVAGDGGQGGTGGAGQNGSYGGDGAVGAVLVGAAVDEEYAGTVGAVDSGDGGEGGDGGDGGGAGDAGFNGAGGHVGTIINYGTVIGNVAFGTTNFVVTGIGKSSEFLNDICIIGESRDGLAGGYGGEQQTEHFWTVRPVSCVLGGFESWTGAGVLLAGEDFGSSGIGFAYVTGELPKQYLPQDLAALGADGTDGKDGAAGGRRPRRGRG